MSLTAVIPVRAGSERVRNKNIRPFAGSSLLERKIRQLQTVPDVDEILVSSDSAEMLSLAASLGVSAQRRPSEFCDEKSRTFNEVVEYIASEQVRTDLMLWAPCVCPLVSGERIQQGIQVFREILAGRFQGDSVVSALLLKEYIFDEQGPVNFSVARHVPSQRLPAWHCIVNGFFVARRADMARWRFVYGPRPRLVELSRLEALDIDDEDDFRLAELAVRMTRS